MAFSFTAPLITVEQEQEERDALTNDERDIIHSDVIGTNLDDFVETAEQVVSAAQRMEDAMARIPDREKAAYLEARVRCPLVVATESSPIRFLRVTMWRNDECAARLLAEYWGMRLKIFQELAFLPLTLTGALANDHELIRAHPRICFNLPDDNHGRAMISFDRGHYDIRRYGRFALLRVAWYKIHLAAEEEMHQKLGMVILEDMDSFSLPQKFDRIQTKLLFKSFSLLPIRVVSCHVQMHTAFAAIVMSMSRIMLSKDIRVRTTVYNTIWSFLRGVRDCGIDVANIPTFLGGQLEQNGEDFLQSRIEIENNNRRINIIG